MSTSDRLHTPHPGETILEDFLKPWRMTPYRLATGMGVAPTRVAQILKGERGISAETALRLSRFLGASPEFWMGLQASYELRHARERLAGELETIQRYHHGDPVCLDDEEESEDARPADEAA